MSAAVETRPSVRPLDAPFGAEIAGVDLSKPLDDATFDTIRRAYFENSIVVFHGQRLTPEQQIAFSRASASSRSMC